MDKLKICVDLNDAFNSKLGLYNSFKERDSNLYNEKYKSVVKSDTLTEQLLIDAKKNGDFDKLLFASPESSKLLLELAVERGKLWANGKELKVKFLNGTEFLHQKVIVFAKQWEQFANIKFTFIKSGDAEIRVSFLEDKGSWSYIGTDALNITDQSEPTMNFGWFDNSTTDFEFSRTIIHEFGHSLGCIHEHQSPGADIDWKKEIVYAYYKNTQTPPWDKEQVDHNIFDKYTSGEVTNSTFDPKSIMLYPIPASFTNNGFSVGMNAVLSPNDKMFIAQCYPK